MYDSLACLPGLLPCGAMMPTPPALKDCICLKWALERSGPAPELQPSACGDALLFLLSRPNPYLHSPPHIPPQGRKRPFPQSGQWTSLSFKGNLKEGGEEGRQNGSLVHERTFQVPRFASWGKMWVAARILRGLRQGDG